MAWFDVEPVCAGVWRVNDGDMDNCYVLDSGNRVGVVDTGLGIGDLASVVADTASGPPLVINTHCHPDHWQGNVQFADTSMSAAEWEWVQGWHLEDDFSELEALSFPRPFPPAFDPSQHRGTRIVTPKRLWHDGDYIELGGFRLEVIPAPGHTPGGIVLLERERRLLFTGDTVLCGQLWLHLEESLGHAVLTDTYARLALLADMVDLVLPGHGVPLSASFLVDLCSGMQRVLRGELCAIRKQTFAGEGWYYDLGGYGALLRERVEGETVSS